MKFKKIFILVAGSLLYLSIPVLISPDLGTGRNLFSIQGFLNQFTYYVATLVFFFINYFLLLPTFFNKRNRWWYALIVSAIGLLYCTSVLFSTEPPQFRQGANSPPLPPELSSNLPQPLPAPNASFDRPPPEPRTPRSRLFLTENTVLFLLVLTFSISVFIYNRWQAEMNAKLINENKYLRAQIEPHFFFNSLNSIFSLVVTKNDQAPEAIIKMADMMRYVLTESSKNEVLLDDELKYIQTYIDFQKTRFNNIEHIKFQLHIPPNDFFVVPLILIPFIENVFKHGINGEETHIEIDISLTQSTLTLSTKNKKFTSTETSTGIGIENARKRLEMSYPGQHTLSIFEDVDSYFVKLSMQLTNDQSHRHR